MTVANYWGNSRTAEYYPTLTRVMRVLLSIPHSNASSERVFSMLKKIVTDQRSLLAPDTVNALLRVKMNESNCCIGTHFDGKTLKSLKRAALMYNEKHQSGSASTSTEASAQTSATITTVDIS